MTRTSSAELTSRWARRFVLASAAFLLAFAIADVLGSGRRTLVVVGLLGFVFHMVFGKAYSLLPAYFDRELVTPRGMPLHLVLTAGGTALLALDSATTGSWGGDRLAIVGAAAWTAGVAVFVGTILWTVRTNLAGGETGTGDVNADRSRVDRIANAAVPVALGYLVIGSYGLLAHYASLPGPFGYFPVVSHLLAAGTAAMLVFGVGFRLLPRFLVVQVHPWTAAIVLSTGAIAPILIALGLGGEPSFLHGGAVAQAVAVVGFSVAYVHMFLRSDRRRVGLYGVLLGTTAGALAVLVGLDMALWQSTAGLGPIHFRLNVIGFLGLVIVGVAYQFYPPTAGRFRFASNGVAFAAIGCFGGGLLLQLVAAIASGVGEGGTAPGVVEGIGRLVVLVGALVHTALLVGLFRDRYGPRL